MRLSDLAIHEQIDYLARQVIIASIQYYDLNTNVIEDREYDILAKKLQLMIEKYPNETQNSYYSAVLKDYTAATGFDLPSKLTKEDREYLTKLALFIIKQQSKSEKGRK